MIVIMLSVLKLEADFVEVKHNVMRKRKKHCYNPQWLIISQLVTGRQRIAVIVTGE